MRVEHSGIVTLVALLCCGCVTETPDPKAAVEYAVRATIEALPTSTLEPTPRPIPTAGEFSLAGVFCEYEFCVGHPRGMAYYDVVAKQNPNSPAASSYAEGRLATNDQNRFIQLIWQTRAGTSEPDSLLDLVIDDGVDARSGPLESLAVAATDATVVPLLTNATELLPYGAAAAWTCGDRAFAWKAYANLPEAPRSLLIETLQSFRCNP